VIFSLCLTGSSRLRLDDCDLDVGEGAVIPVGDVLLIVDEVGEVFVGDCSCNAFVSLRLAGETSLSETGDNECSPLYSSS